MVGLIWFVQIVHYPLFRRVGKDEFPAYERDHQSQTTWVVLPLMFVEASTATAMLIARPAQVSMADSVLGLALLATAWISTFFVQVPAHARLSSSFDEATHRRLVRTNWLRTMAWSGRGVLLILICGRMIAASR
jgi:hypothetical protein